ncbi:MAG: peptidoglycan DD-metalloendopeptidase family protein [Bacteroidales bacterium]
MLKVLFFLLAVLNFQSLIAQDSLNFPLSVDTFSAGPINDEEYEEEFKFENVATNVYYKPTIIDNYFDAPAYNEYLFWDTVDIHPYISKMNLFDDNRTLDLVNVDHFFTFPTLSNRITSEFGWRRWRYHYGIDIGINEGDTIVSAFDGVVRIAKYSKSYGYTVVIRHYNGLETLYAHLSKLLVSPNQEVKSGEIIALGGNTGRSSGPHLHFEVRYLGGPINPREIINFENKTLKYSSITVDQCLFNYLTEIHKARYHKVRKGDSLGKIARKYGVSINRLCKLNGISRKKILRPGQKIRYT